MPREKERPDEDRLKDYLDFLKSSGARDDGVTGLDGAFLSLIKASF